MRLRRSVGGVSVLLVMLGGASCFGMGKGRVTIVYQDGTIQPENREAMRART